MSEKKKLIFISRHDPNDGQVALVKSLGYSGIKKIPIVFTEDPVRDLQNAGVNEKKIAIVAPSYISNQLLNAGFELIEFVNEPSKRERGVFVCRGAYIYKLPDLTGILQEGMERLCHITPFAWGAYTPPLPSKIKGEIKQEFIPCPLSIEEQEESALCP
nr:MAG: hypothetical protein [Lokiarchaeota virus Skoll Meg22_1214]